MWKVCAAHMATGRKGSKPATNTVSTRGGSKSSSASTAASTDAATDIVATVRGLAEVVADHALSELIVDLPEATITLRRGVSSATAVALQPPLQMAALPAPPASTLHFAQPPGPSGAPAAAPPPVDDKSHVVTSPFVGTFYRRPNPDASAYVEQGQKVEKGAVLCIIEAMKLMNEIEADVAGVVVGVMAEDGAAVEYGQPLFRIAPA
jgi:acetyl-CoA carboxylase biotin carboxyl carrier protein